MTTPSRSVALGVAFLAALAAQGAGRTDWPAGVLNYCGFEGRWDEAGWRDSAWMQGGIPEIDFDANTKVHGRYSLRIIGSPDEDRYAIQLAGNDIDAAKVYVFQGWVKTDNVQGTAKVAALAHGEKGPLDWVNLGPGALFTGTRDWTRFELPLRSFPEGSKRVYLYAMVRGTGTAWFDEFSLAEEGVEVPLGGEKVYTDADYAGLRFDDGALAENLLQGPGFEEGLGSWVAEVGTPVIDRKVAGEGTASLRIDAEPEGRCVVYQRVRLDPRRAYRLSLSLKTELRLGLSCIRVIPFRADGSGFGWWFVQDHTSEFLHGRGRSGWRREEIVLRHLRPETDYVVVYLTLEDAEGKAWFDDVRLTPLSLAETKAVAGQ